MLFQLFDSPPRPIHRSTRSTTPPLPDDKSLPLPDTTLSTVEWAQEAFLPISIALEVIDNILSFLPRKDVASCTRVNKNWYLASKPHLFKVVTLTTTLSLDGPNHPILDKNDGARPVFRCKWMTRHCHTLCVAEHSYLACQRVTGATDTNVKLGSHLITPTFPPLPHHQTLNLPYDVHWAVEQNRCNQACGFYRLQGVRNLILRDFWTDDKKPAQGMPAYPKFPDASLDKLTIMLAQQRHRYPYEGPHGYRTVSTVFQQMWYLDAVKPSGDLTIVFPYFFRNIPLHPIFSVTFELPNASDPYPYNLFAFEALGGGWMWSGRWLSALSLVSTAAVASALKGRPRIRLVGFEDFGYDETDKEWLMWFVSTYARGLLSEWTHLSHEGIPHLKTVGLSLKQVEQVSSVTDDLMFQMQRGDWATTASGRAALVAPQTDKWGT
ncbi:hypothetical protein CspHIS471_0301070 [Cutaneotrichosporon sp. HIS471]|nr:hypothetical protein CspHIS471_0301070 [Cutaneotrichosporon sp. HIS471]